MIHGAQNDRAPNPEPEPDIYIDIFMDTSIYILEYIRIEE